MDLNIKTITGECHSLTVQPEDTVGYVKTLIRDRFNVPIQNQRLLFSNGRNLDLNDDSRTVASYGLHSGSTVSLLITKPAPMQVFVRNEKGQLNTYEIQPNETVRNFKKKVEAREGVQASQQRLIHQGREMMDGLLSDYKVEALSTIDLNLRLRGG